MSIFDDAEFGLPEEVDGVVVPPEDIAADAEAGEWATYISWPIVVRWCREHPGYGRRFEGLYSGVSTKLRKKYPDLIVKTSRHRREPGRPGPVCDLIVAYVPRGHVSPFDIVPGMVVRPPEPGERPRDDTGRFVRMYDDAPGSD
jgi:hypothetical protein